MIILIQKSNMNWEKKLDGLSFLSLKSKDGESSRYVKVSDVKDICELAFNEALDKLKMEQLFLLHKEHKAHF